MTVTPLTSSTVPERDWSVELGNLAYAQGMPLVRGTLKAQPEDFKVTELMDVIPCGEGEHYWLDISKVKCNTEQVAKALARFAQVSPRDVGYSGMKDFFAETRQWFSVWRPQDHANSNALDWSAFEMNNVTIHEVSKHQRKIRRGTHRANQFRIILRDLTGDLSTLESRLLAVKKNGVPNYFGPQRFGRDAGNMVQAYAMLVQGKRIKNRNLRSIVLSSARSWLFNTIVSARVENGSWQALQSHEPANLDGSKSVFHADGGDQQTQRLQDLDIHPTAPLWGEGVDKLMSQCADLAAWEQQQINDFTALQQGLEGARLDYQRRALRTKVQQFAWQLYGTELQLEFVLHRGEFATSVIREIMVSQ